MKIAFHANWRCRTRFLVLTALITAGMVARMDGADVFGSWWGGASGVHETQVAATEQNGRIVLFGAGSTGIHVEAFRLEDGGNLFRFSSSY